MREISMTYEQITEANKLIKTTPIKGKEYAEVPQRVKAFRFLYPQGFIETEMISNENGICVFKAEAGYYDHECTRLVLGTGHAYEKEGHGFINQTSYIENCETSAVGRALGFLGIGSDTSIASYEEVANAKVQQEENKRISDKEAITLENMLQQNQKDWVLAQFKITAISQLTKKQYTQVINSLKAKENGK